MTEFLLIRHGANDYTRTHKLAGWTPEVHLNEHGLAQAAALGEYLAKRTIHVLYSSPLERTVETAQAILAHHPELTLQTIDDVGEVRYGAWQGQELGKLAGRKLWRDVQIAPSRVQFPGGETMRAVQMRAVNALEMLYERHPRQTVAVVSHSDVIKLMVAHFLGLHIDLFQRLEVSTASLTILHLGAGRASLELLNETNYLPAEPPKKPEGSTPEAAESNGKSATAGVAEQH